MVSWPGERLTIMASRVVDRSNIRDSVNTDDYFRQFI